MRRDLFDLGPDSQPGERQTDLEDLIAEKSEPNTCERAWAILQRRHGAARVAFRIETRVKMAQAGTVSDGTRSVYLEPCGRFRWIRARTYEGKVLAEVDQRDHWDDPAAMVYTLNRKIAALEIITA